MATLSEDQLAAVRSWVGSETTEDDLNARYTRLSSLTATVEEVLREQLVLLTEQPSSMSLPSGLSVTITQNITALQQRLKDFRANANLDSDTSGSGFEVLRLRRTGAR